MKVREAISRLKVGDEVWVKGEVAYINKSGVLPLCIKFAERTKVFVEADEISLTEPQGEKVEVSDFVAEWYESHKDNLEDAISEQIDHGHDVVLDTRKAFDVWFFDESDCPIETLIRMKDGYTVKPKRWVVKIGDYHSTYIESLTIIPKLRYTLSEQEGAYKFTNHERAEAVATLVDGSVEEID